MTDDDRNYYDVLGVDADSSKDEIRSAYRERVEELRGGGEPSDADRSEIARLNSAWSTLSDPFQRQRYDSGLSGTELVDDDEYDDEDASDGATVPAARPKGLFGRLLTPPEPAGAKGAGGAAARPARPAATDPGPNWPPGLRPPATADKMIAFLIDFIVLAMLLQLAFFVVTKVESDTTDALNNVDDQIEQVDDEINEAEDDIDRAQDDNNADAEQQAEDRKEALEREKDDLEEQSDDLIADLQGPNLIASAGVLVVGLAYLVIPSLANGQSFGKRLRRVRVVSSDGSRAGPRQLLLHYGLPVVLTLALFPLVQVYAVLIGLVVVLIKNRDKQGLHDRIAKTLVVQADSAPNPPKEV